MSRRTTYNPAGMVSTHRRPVTDGSVTTDLGEATVDELIDQMSHRQ
ncbi:hypothetical protein [Halorubrum sp. ASP1]|jgi:hypothetical protein|nr:hypothetical protein [Halorubrum sp. ASP1]